VLKHPGVKKVVVVDIDELVVDTVREYFPDLCRGFEDSRTQLVIDDGANYLQNSTERFDVIIVDAFDPGGPIQSLSTQPFYEQLQAHLSEEGIVVIQTDSPTTNPEPLRQTLSAVSSLFESYRPYICSMPTLPEGMCSFCICSPKALDFSIRSADKAIAIEEQCSYYSRQIHEASFALPRYVRELVSA
jgi:spermidine synthase